MIVLLSRFSGIHDKQLCVFCFKCKAFYHGNKNLSQQRKIHFMGTLYFVTYILSFLEVTKSVKSSAWKVCTKSPFLE